MKIAEIGAKRLSLFLRLSLSDSALEKAEPFLEDNAAAQDICSAEENYVPETQTGNCIWSNICQNELARVCVELAFFHSQNRFVFEKLFQLVTEKSTDGVTLEMSAAVLGFHIGQIRDMVSEAYGIVSKILTVNQFSDIHNTVFTADFSLIRLFCDDIYIPRETFKRYVKLHICRREKYFPLWDSEINGMSDSVFSSQSPVTFICGAPLSGKRTTAKKFADLHGCNLLLVDYKYFVSSEQTEQDIAKILRDCFLLQAALCICGLYYDETNTSGQRKAVDIINSVLSDYASHGLPLFITAESPSVTSVTDLPCHVFTVPKLTVSQSAKLWRFFAEEYRCAEENCFDETAKRIIMPAGKIKNTVCTASSLGITNDRKKLIRLCYDRYDDTPVKGLNKIYPEYEWDDLKLAEKEKNTLKWLCDYVEHKNTVMEEFGMTRDYLYGKCASALFIGPPGTGKTMSAHVVANRLGMVLCCADISQIMDKYIGETEKHLDSIFTYAENSGAALFFDEADALVGKRSEISDSNARYANNQVAYLLQRIESFDGVVLMATNLSNNIDNAVLRRIRYVVNFSMPDRTVREEIWRSLFRGKIPHENLDFSLLSSDNFEFSGADIKNIVLNAAVLAVSNNSPVTMSHIAESIRIEYIKANRTSLPPELREYFKS